MPFHRLAVVYEVDVWRTICVCTCATGAVCNCEPSGYWDREQRQDVIRLWFDFGEPCPGWRPSYSRGYPVPEKVPRRQGREALPSLRAAPQRGGRPSSSPVGWTGRPVFANPSPGEDPMNRLLLIALLFVSSSVLAQTDVTLNNDIEWDASSGADRYEVRILTSGNGPFWPDNTNLNIVHDNLGATIFDLAQALTGVTPAVFKFNVRAVAAGVPTTWSALTINYLGIAAPQNLRVVILAPPQNLQVAWRQFAHLVNVAVEVATAA